jgi:hypothetical protein
MIAKFFFILVAFNFSALAAASSISSEFLNSELKKNYSFIERSLNQSDLKIETSSGKSFLIRLVSRLMC